MKIFNKILILIPFVLAAANEKVVMAQTSITIETSFAYESEYVFRGVQFADQSFQPSVEIGFGSFYLGTWVNAPIVDPDAQFLNEIDFYGGFGFDLGERLSLDIGLTYYWFPEEPTSASQTREVYAGFGFDLPASPELYFFYDFDLDTFTIEAAVGHSISLGHSADSPLTLDLGATLGYVHPKSGTSGVYYGGSADLSYALSPNNSLSFGLRTSGIESGISSGRRGNFWWGMSFTAGF